MNAWKNRSLRRKTIMSSSKFSRRVTRQMIGFIISLRESFERNFMTGIMILEKVIV